MMSALLGCIADDFTGGTDLAGMLVKSGMRTVQMIGVPTEPLPDGIDAIVIALKSRTAPVDDAVAESLAALRNLQERGGRHALVGRLVPHVQQPKAGCRLCRTGPHTVAKRIGPPGPGRLQGRQSPAANDHDPDRLAVAAASAAVSAGRVVPRADQAHGRPSRQDDDRCSGAQAAGRALEVCDSWRSDRGGRPQSSLIKMPPCPQSPGA